MLWEIWALLFPPWLTYDDWCAVRSSCSDAKRVFTDSQVQSNTALRWCASIVPEARIHETGLVGTLNMLKVIRLPPLRSCYLRTQLYFLPEYAFLKGTSVARGTNQFDQPYLCLRARHDKIGLHVITIIARDTYWETIGWPQSIVPIAFGLLCHGHHKPWELEVRP